jgi:hypothetical protein
VQLIVVNTTKSLMPLWAPCIQSPLLDLYSPKKTEHKMVFFELFEQKKLAYFSIHSESQKV